MQIESWKRIIATCLRIILYRSWYTHTNCILVATITIDKAPLVTKVVTIKFPTSVLMWLLPFPLETPSLLLLTAIVLLSFVPSTWASRRTFNYAILPTFAEIAKKTSSLWCAQRSMIYRLVGPDSPISGRWLYAVYINVADFSDRLVCIREYKPSPSIV